MKVIKTEDAIGHVLCQDMTQIIPGKYKDARFRKGHIVTKEDIPILLSMGKENLYVWEMKEGILHENDAALRMCNMCISDGMVKSEVKEGKIEITASEEGLFVVDTTRLNQINSIDELMIATIHGNTLVKPGDKLCGTRVIPLVIEEEKIKQAETITNGKPILSLLPLKLKKAGIITTGSEVFHGRIEDSFTPVVKKKLAEVHIETVKHILLDDGIDNIVAAIDEMKSSGVDVIICTGGMSVDPDDNTPGAIKKAGAEIVTYGAPVLPGAMFLLGYLGDCPIMGLPGCVMYAKATIFDMVLPRIAAGIKMTKKDFVEMGEGGLCLGCKECHFPNCGYGK